ncbi:carbohydrate ABC transporter permease [Pectinatus frisingensis]|uniref:carbohydrate ABC transporter permease n=1 Tax=Pectinatus frisingensis TaxID=865 RepID=UPI001E41EA6A|nr:carbohydrate ABC transporter permease [Pectinatus frisingensis]
MKKNCVRYLILIVMGLIILAPFFYAVIVSFESAEDTLAFPPVFVPGEIYIKSYLEAFRTAPLVIFIINSFVVSLSVTVGQVITCSLAGYAFAFLEFPFKKVLFIIFLSTMMIPAESIIIPNYFTIRSLGWLDSYQGLAVPFMASAFGTFLLRQYFQTLPREIYDAARIDGCGRLRFFLTMVLPLSKPAIATLAVYAFLTTYNQYMWPLLITNTDGMRTVQIGLAMLQWDQGISWNTTMAGIVIVSLPTVILLIAGQKQLVKGLTAGSVKG